MRQGPLASSPCQKTTLTDNNLIIAPRVPVADGTHVDQIQLPVPCGCTDCRDLVASVPGPARALDRDDRTLVDAMVVVVAGRGIDAFNRDLTKPEHRLQSR